MAGGATAAIQEQFMTRCPQLIRPAWLPAEKARQASDRPTASRFGGNRPFRIKNFRWPRCDECKGPKHFLLQLEVRTLPAEVRTLTGLQEGLLQVFYCVFCSPCRDVFDDLSVISAAEMVPSLQSLAAMAIVKAGLDLEGIPRKLREIIEGYTEEFYGTELEVMEVGDWVTAGREIPSYTEMLENREVLEEAGISFDVLEEAWREDSESLGELGWHIPDIKLGGWIQWVADVEYPLCPECNVEMNVPLLQMEDAPKMEYMPGQEVKCGIDMKTLHITICPSCSKPGLGWSCHDDDDFS